MNELTGKETKWSSPGGYCKLLKLNEVAVRWYSDSNSLTINGKSCDEFKTQLIHLNKQLQLESEDTNAACVSGNSEISINFDEEAASNESENQISTGQLNEYESLLNTVRSLEAKLESRINDLASEVHETRLELHVEKIARGNLEAEYTELASEALEIRSELDIRNLTRDENETSSLVFLVKENASLKDENALLKQQINNYKCITSDLRTKVKDLENEKDSLVTVIKILHDDQNQHTCHANKSIASWNVVNNHKRSQIGRGSLKNYSTIGPSGDIRDKDGATRIKNQYIVLSDDIDNSEASEDDSVILKSTQAPQNKEIQDTSKERPKFPKHGCVAEIPNTTKTKEKLSLQQKGFEEDWRLYKSSRNVANTALRSAKRDYYANKFTNNKQNPKYAWRTINDILGRNRKQTTINEIKLPGKTVTSTDELVDIFNDHFSNIGPKLAESIPNDNDKGQRSMLDNYRPISILPVVSKLMKRIMYDQMYEYLNQNNLFSKHQFGFRPYHSTTTTLLDCTNEWYTNMDRGLYNLVVFLDLKKALDTVDHEILLSKFEMYGFQRKALNLLRCYLTHRTQSCQLASILSLEKEIICGIPQGSILGPLLFIMYINDLPSCLERSTPRMFADDTNLTAIGRTISEAEERASVDMRNVQKWLCANKLSLNIAKTEYVLIGTRHKISNIDTHQGVKINNQLIKKIKNTKALGVELDENLS
ncbi:Hypothetical predicted protein [Paramuricea clavata]|uniref:Uncharacterized protein n=1 Tax=Paramuricea clavata TaxID=317549 RepID=A0A7D9I4E6_PARCT|nr:Hypothetical predicted protein [Paramuricea clavata]